MNRLRGMVMTAATVIAGAMTADTFRRGASRLVDEIADRFGRAHFTPMGKGTGSNGTGRTADAAASNGSRGVAVPPPTTPRVEWQRGSAPAPRSNGAGERESRSDGGPIDRQYARKPAVAPARLFTAGDEDQHDTTLENVHGPIGYVRELFKRFSGDYCASWAASLSFFSILSIAPILLCGLAVLTYMIHDPAEATFRAQDLLARVLPGGPGTAQRQAADLIRQFNVETSVHTLYAQRGPTAVVGLLSLVWAAMQIFVNASVPMNVAFRTRETRGWIKVRLISLALLFGAGILFLLALAPAYLAQVLKIPDHDPILSPTMAVVLIFVGVAINAAMFAIIYRCLPSPSANVSWKAAAMSGCIVAVLWEVAKEGFAYYLARFAHYDKVYGSLGTMIGLILWIYYTSIILLLGAEIAKLYLDAQAGKRSRPEAVPGH